MNRTTRTIISLLLCLIVLCAATGTFAETSTATLQGLYADAELLMATGDYAGAAAKFEALGMYSDASQMAMYCKAVSAAEDLGMYELAAATFQQLGSFRDSEQMMKYYTGRGYEAAALAFATNDITSGSVTKADLSDAKALYETAAETYAGLALYKDCLSRYANCSDAAGRIGTEINVRNYAAAVALKDAGKYEEAIKAFKALNGYKDSAAQITACETAIKDRDYAAAVALYDAGKYEEAIKAFKALNGYKDSAAQITKCETAIKDRDYDAAVALYNTKKFKEAIKAFKALNGYKDSKMQIEMIEAFMKTKDYFQYAEVGETVFFGHYEQDNSTSNGKEDIEWIVLDKQGTNLLLISKYALDCQKYNSSFTDVTWETCTLRTWLNGTFLNAAFSAAEQKQIVTTTVSADKNPKYSTNPGNATQDKVFLLSIDEANKYFKTDDARACAGTAYAYAQGAYKAGNGNCWWWLRSPGYDQLDAAFVNNDGIVSPGGIGVNDDYSAVRPAFWIDLAS